MQKRYDYLQNQLKCVAGGEQKNREIASLLELLSQKDKSISMLETQLTQKNKSISMLEIQLSEIDEKDDVINDIQITLSEKKFNHFRAEGSTQECG